MNKRPLVILLLFITLLIMLGCDQKATDKTGSVRLSVSGLADISPTARYETWLIVDGEPYSIGRFNVNSQGMPSATTFTTDQSLIDAATGCFITIEAIPDPSSAPSDFVILAGDFVTPSDSTHINNAPLYVAHHLALNNTFVNATGKYILSSPTDTNTLNETSGVWFMNISTGYPLQGLTLPTLPAHWKYEAWAVIDEHTVSMGRFSVANQSDESSHYSGTGEPPAFPGEDFVNDNVLNAEGILTPVILSGKNIFITVQPDASFITTPFFLTILKSAIPSNAAPHLTYTMTNQAATSSPSGIAYR